MRIYVSGPMNGHALWNFPAFEEATTALRARGHEVVSPAEIDEEEGLVKVQRRQFVDPDGEHEDLVGWIEDVVLTDAFDFRTAIARDLDEIDRCDALFLLPGWEKSLGARIEVDRAKALGLRLFSEIEDVPRHQIVVDPLCPPGQAFFIDQATMIHEPITTPWHPEPVEATLPSWGITPGPPPSDDPTVRALAADLERGVWADDTNPKDRIGDTKPQLHLVPPSAVIRMAKVFELGARKYGDYNWREKKVRHTVYLSAALRHLAQLLDGETTDPESGQPHAAHVAACMAIVLDADATGNLVDDRPTPGAAGALIKELS